MRRAVDALDHLVLATPDLERTAGWVTERTGITPSPGGQHVGLGTRNVLCSLGRSSYLEIIGPDPEQAAPDGPRPFGIDGLREASMVAWAIAVNDIDAEIAASRARGYDPGEAVAMQRERPDGVLLQWRLTFAPSIVVPFLIEWGTTSHPASSAAPGLELADLQGAHPSPGQVSATLDALAVSMGVLRGEEALVVELRGPLGAISFP